MNRLWVRLSLAFLVVTWSALALVALVVRGATESGFRAYVVGQGQARFSPNVVAAMEAYYAENGAWPGVESLLPGLGGGGEDSAGAGSSAGHGNGNATGSGAGTGQGGSGGGNAAGGNASGAGTTDTATATTDATDTTATTGGAGQGGSGGRGAQVFVADREGVIVVASDDALLGTALSADDLAYATPLVVDGETVGYAGQQTPGTVALGEAEQSFLSQTTGWLVAAAVGAGVLSVLLGLAFAWTLAHPLARLTQAARAVAAGELGRQVDPGGTAETVALARAFNQMSGDLAAGEALRQRIAADVAHELRTPVSVLRGHLEAMLDGVFPADGEHLAVAYDQTLHLARLVDDLRLLTLAEAGRLPLARVLADPAALAETAVGRFGPLALDAGITLAHEIAPDLPPVRVDVDRMQQVFGNLLSNALRHTPSGGQITLAVSGSGTGRVRFAVRNTGGGLTPEKAAHVFDRFWRADDARERDQGGSGLGLAITRQLVALHGGTITVDAAPDATTFTVELPAA
ncbi:MAG: HAMP domain-containing protein [Anaerolineae bacterium]|nr:HAMP domain-containing protein [Anaerolineae bacterium]